MSERAPRKELIRLTPEQVEERATELMEAGYRIVAISRYGCGDTSLLLKRDLPPEPRSES